MIALLITLNLGTPAEASEHVERARQLLDAGDHDAARAAFESAAAADDENVAALYGAALLALGAGDAAAAIAHAQALLMLDPYDDDARAVLAQAHLEAGNVPAARQTIDDLLARHPESELALALEGALPDEEDATRSRWRPLLRVGLHAGVDTNVALAAGALPAVSDVTAGSAGVSFSGGVLYATAERPFTLLGHFGMRTALNDRDNAEAYMPTTVGLSATGRTALGPLLTALDLRYEELFTKTFTQHRQRLIGPSLSGAIDVHPQHRLRLLFGADIRMPSSDVLSTNTTLQLTLRERATFGPLALVLDVALRKNVDSADVAVAQTGAGFGEVGGTLYAEVEALSDLDLYAAFENQHRAFDDESKESTYGLHAGARYGVGDFEIYVQYAFAQNLSSTRGYTRHQAGAGVRFWYF